MIFKLLDYVFDLFFDDCLYCKNPTGGKNNTLCTSCFSELEYINSCFKCLDKFCHCEHRYIILYKYNRIIKKLILQLKYGEKELLTDFFAKEIFEKTNIKNIVDENTVLVPVPISFSRLFKRNYNQSVLLCKSISKYVNCPIEYFVLSNSNHKSQFNANAEQRRKNVHKIQMSDPSGIMNKNVIIVDDVIASGSTTDRCIELLKPYAKNITVLSIAKS